VPPRIRKARRYVVVFFGLLLVVLALGLLKFAQISSLLKKGKEAERAGPPPEAVGEAIAQLQSWEGTLTAVGSVSGVKIVQLTNQVAGRVERLHFESGQSVKKDQDLVELDTEVERADLAAARSRRDLAKVTVRRSRALVAEGVLAQTELDKDEGELKAATSAVAGVQAQIERKRVRAPFSGRLGIREVNVGQYLNPGTTLTTLEEDGAVYVDFSLPQQRLESVRQGMGVRVKDGGSVTGIEGVISAVDAAVDEPTRNLKLRASVPNRDEKLRPGMFVNVSVVMPQRQNVVTVPVTAIVHASYGDSVFVIEKKKPGSPGMDRTPDGKPVQIARQQFVKVSETRGDFVAITKGLTAGQTVVSAGAFKLRNGAPVVIDNSVKPEPKLNPRPENR